MSTRISGSKDVIIGANMSELYFLACVFKARFHSGFVLRKDLHIPHGSNFCGAAGPSVAHKNNPLFLPLCHSSSCFVREGFQGGGWFWG